MTTLACKSEGHCPCCDRVHALQGAIHEAFAMGWCRESRDVLRAALAEDPEAVREAVEAAAGYIEEAEAVLAYHEALEDVLRLASEVYWEAHPVLRKVGFLKRLGAALKTAALMREDYSPQALWDSRPL